MGKAGLVTLFLLLLSGLSQFCFADDISQPGEAEIIGAEIQNAISEMFESLQTNYNAQSEGLNYLNSSGGGCVDVDIQMTDTVYLNNPGGSIVTSHFELTNCGSVAAFIYLDFTVTLDFGELIDTAYVIPPVPVWLGPGQSFVSNCQFPVPPIEGAITVCVTARDGDAEDYDCGMTVVTASGSPGTPYSGCGVLVQTPNCLLFAGPSGLDTFYYQPDTSWMTYLVLENYGSFQAGDSVFVSGTMFMYGDTLCPEANGRLESNSIDYCDTVPSQFYEACGILIQGVECILFQSIYQDSLVLILDNLAGFGVFDTVHVTGLYDPGCYSFCMEGDGCLRQTQIESCGGNPSDTINACGILHWNQYCMMFTPLDSPMMGDSAYYIQNYDGYGDRDTVYVEGTIMYECDVYCGEPVIGCIVSNTIDSCGAAPPVHFEGCGILIPFDNCVVFAPLSNIYNPYALLHYGSFGVGDTVFVAGVIDGYVDACSLQTIPLIINNVINACNENPPDTLYYSGCGMLIEQYGCALFAAFDDLIPPVVLDEYGNFGIYDTVYVSGMVEFGCQSSCGYASDVCLHNDSIYACSTYPPEPYGACGVLMQTNDCLLFNPFTSDTLYYLDPFAAWQFVLDNYGIYGHGDTVRVYGNLEIGCSTVCAGALGCIYDNTIESCSPPPDTIYYGGCGYLFTDSGCVKFLPDNGMFPPLLLTDYGSFGEGDTVRVEGLVDLTVGCECMGIMQPCLDNYLIEDCSGQPNDSFYFSGCGALIEDSGCVFFFPDDNMFYKALLTDYGSFTAGDSVYVEGLVMLDLMNGCECRNMPYHCIYNNVITECNTNPSGDTLSICGMLMGDSDCIYLVPMVYDTLIYVYGYLLDNYGGFGIYDTVLVTGEVVPINPSPDCPEVYMQFINNTISYCGFGPADSVSIMDNLTATNFPNPFNPITVISISLPVATPVSLKIYNILGQEVETLLDGEVMQGEHQVVWDGSGRASGVYFYRIATDQGAVTRKMTLTK